MNDDWIDNILDGEPTPITNGQWLFIESRIDQTSLTPGMKSDILGRINDLTELEAEEIITQIFENEVKTNPQDQWKEMCKRNVFGNRDF